MRRSVPLSRDAGVLSSSGAGVEHAVSSCSSLSVNGLCVCQRLRLKAGVEAAGSSSGAAKSRRPDEVL